MMERVIGWGPAAAVVAVCALLSGVMRVSIDSFAVFLLPLSAEFGWARAELTGIYGVIMLFFGLGCPVAGRMMDLLGPRWTYGIGLVVIAIAFLGATEMSAIWQFYFILATLVGFGTALIGMVSHATLLSRWFRANLTTAIAIAAASSGVSMLIAAPALQLLVDDAGWRSAYAVMGVGLLGLTLAFVVLPWGRLSQPAAASQPASAPATDPPQTVPGATRAAFLAVLSQPTFWALFGIQFLTAVSMFSLNPQIVAFLIEQGFEPVGAATAFGMAGLAGTVGLIAFGRVADRYGRRLAMTISYSMSFAGFALLLAIMAAPAWSLVGLFVLIYGPTFGSRGPIVNAMVPRLFGRGPSLGLILGSVHLGMGVGAALGASLGGWLRDTGGYGAVIALAALTGAAGLTLYWSVAAVRKA